ncbi:P1 family peptidase [Limoniibacter endophyticus]|uniref:Peptidase T4 n=1 Tax=Limoniibacter endophyticus TaxID=1565040 RepID=A0A8J3GFW0_9HYPH|nr:P1 family peptidase [Limoniibacter endophyticus]GHC60715.1 peptidase T4 [Limoniibacter endophyticus]
MKAGPRNLLTDVGGLRVGNAEDPALKSGTTVVLCDDPCVAAVQVLGGAPGTRETDLLEPHNTVEHVHALVLSGGSAFGLDAASGVQAALRDRGVGFEVGGIRVPIVPAAILFDLANGGNKDWGLHPPYRQLGYEAAQNASSEFTLGSVGAGSGALTAGLKGGLGSASSVLVNGVTVSALVAVNPLGSVTIGDSPYFWAHAFEIGEEFGGLGAPQPYPRNADRIVTKFNAKPVENTNTTIGIIATDAVLTKAQAKRLAISAHDGFARAIWPSHTPFDGDLVFAIATGKAAITPDPADFLPLCAAANATMARAIARGVHAATIFDDDKMPVWASLKHR